MVIARFVDPDCPGEACRFCTGDACLICMGQGWDAPDCEHDVIDRHGGLPANPSPAPGNSQNRQRPQRRRAGPLRDGNCLRSQHTAGPCLMATTCS